MDKHRRHDRPGFKEPPKFTPENDRSFPTSDKFEELLKELIGSRLQWEADPSDELTQRVGQAAVALRQYVSELEAMCSAPGVGSYVGTTGLGKESTPPAPVEKQCNLCTAVVRDGVCSQCGAKMP